MTQVTSNLGFVKAIHSGSNSPTNTQMLWYDTSIFRHKYFDTQLNVWRILEAEPAGDDKQIQFNNNDQFDGSSEFIWDFNNDRLSIGQGLLPEARIDVRAQSALSTGSGIRVRDNLDTYNILNVRDDGSVEVAESLITRKVLGAGTQLIDISTAGNGSITMSTDAGVGSEASLYLTTGYIELSDYSALSTLYSYFDKDILFENSHGQMRLDRTRITHYQDIGFDSLKAGFYSFNSSNVVLGEYNYIGFGYTENADFNVSGWNIITFNNKAGRGDKTVSAEGRRPVLISTASTTVREGIINSVGLGGTSLDVNKNNTTFTDYLSIKRLESGTPTAVLGIDSSGDVVNGSAITNAITNSIEWESGSSGVGSIRAKNAGNSMLTTDATGDYSLALGDSTLASAPYTIASGLLTFAEGNGAEARGYATKASGILSYASGYGNNTQSGGQYVSLIESSGIGSFTHFTRVSTNSADLTKAEGDYSAILGGTDHHILPLAQSSGIFAGESNKILGTALRSVILGGTGITATEPDTLYSSKMILSEYVSLSTSATITFTRPEIYNSFTTPRTGNITASLTGSKKGIIQKIYHNDVTAPTFPAGWVKMGNSAYVTGEINIIHAEWSEGTRVEYWITQEN